MNKKTQNDWGSDARRQERRGGFRARAKVALSLAILALSGPGATAFAEDPASAEGKVEATGASGFYFAVPVYLYERYSASGVQMGWQSGNWHLRVDLGLIDQAAQGSDEFVAYPSLGLFHSNETNAGIRIYEGVAVGVETGIAKAFAGQVLTINVLTGAEWFASRKKSFFLELGSGVGLFRKEGAFNGGTVIGGGMKCYL